MTIKTSIVIACVQLCALLVFCDGAVVFLGHILNVTPMFTFPGGVGMAESTSICLMVLSLCIIALAAIINHRKQNAS